MDVWKDELNCEKEKKTNCKEQRQYREMAQGQKEHGMFREWVRCEHEGGSRN